MTGATFSSDFPTTAGAFDQTYNGPGSSADVFVTKLSPDGSALIYSTYMGGRKGDFGSDIVLDDAGSAYVIGNTSSINFPTTPGAFDTSYSGHGDSFVAKFAPAGNALLYASYLGGAKNDSAGEITLDLGGNAYVTGVTQSRDFPTTLGAFDETYNGDYDGFVAKINPDGSALVYSTYLGGEETDTCCGISLTITDCVISGNVAWTANPQVQRFGGGIYNGTTSSALIIQNSRIENNRIEGPIGDGNINGVRYLGSGVYNGHDADLAVYESVISQNSICNPTSACAQPSTPHDSWAMGGGLYNHKGRVILQDTTISDNVVNMPDVGASQFRAEGAGIGGECRVELCMQISHSTISGNIAKVSGIADSSADSNRTLGGGISVFGTERRDNLDFDPVEVSIVNTTIAKNRVESSVTGTECDPAGLDMSCTVGGGGLWFKYLTLEIRWVTIAGNIAENTVVDNAKGGGIHMSSEASDDTRLVLRSSIVATNFADGQRESVYVGSRTFVSEGYNLFDDTPTGAIPPLDQVGVMNPKLQPLGAYGGVTHTLRPLLTSAAINTGGMGDPSVLVDQRGYPRPNIPNLITDVGAVECAVSGDCQSGFAPIIPPPARPNQSASFEPAMAGDGLLSLPGDSRGREVISAVAATNLSDTVPTKRSILSGIDTDVALLDTTFAGLTQAI